MRTPADASVYLVNPVAEDLGLVDSTGPGAVLAIAAHPHGPDSSAGSSANASVGRAEAHFYDYLLDACEKLFEGEVEQATFEENMRFLFGTKVSGIDGGFLFLLRANAAGLILIHWVRFRRTRTVTNFNFFDPAVTGVQCIYARQVDRSIDQAGALFYAPGNTLLIHAAGAYGGCGQQVPGAARAAGAGAGQRAKCERDNQVPTGGGAVPRPR